MNVVIDLLAAFGYVAAFIGLAALITAVGEWWQNRNQFRRLPPPPLSNDERIRRYQINSGAYKVLR